MNHYIYNLFYLVSLNNDKIMDDNYILNYIYIYVKLTNFDIVKKNCLLHSKYGGILL